MPNDINANGIHKVPFSEADLCRFTMAKYASEMAQIDMFLKKRRAHRAEYETEEPDKYI